MHYVRASWMNPQFGNWLSVDQHLDEFAYQYANNMPTTATDPSGTSPADDLAAAVAELHSERIPDVNTAAPESYLKSVSSSRLSYAQIEQLLCEYRSKLTSREISFLVTRLKLLRDQWRSAATGPDSPSPSGVVGGAAAPAPLTNSRPQTGAGSKPAVPGAGNAPRPPSANPEGITAGGGSAPRGAKQHGPRITPIPAYGPTNPY